MNYEDLNSREKAVAAKVMEIFMAADLTYNEANNVRAFVRDCVTSRQHERVADIGRMPAEYSEECEALFPRRKPAQNRPAASDTARDVRAVGQWLARWYITPPESLLKMSLEDLIESYNTVTPAQK